MGEILSEKRMFAPIPSKTPREKPRSVMPSGLPYLRKMTGLLRAELVLTPKMNVISFHPTEDSESAFSKMAFANVDYAPVLSGSKIVGCLWKKDQSCSLGKTCGELARRVVRSNRIPSGLCLDVVFKRLVDEPFLFVMENRCLKGIITRADINKRAFRTLLFMILSELESWLVNLIHYRISCETNLHLLSEDRAKEVLYNFWMAKAGNMEIALEQYLSFSDIVNIIMKSNDNSCWQLMGYGSKKQVERLGSLIELRNKVAHSTRNLTEREDSILDIFQEYTKIWELLENLEENSVLDDKDILTVNFIEKTKDFQFVLKSGAVVRTTLDDPNGKELKEIGQERLKKFLTSSIKNKKADKKTVDLLKRTTAMRILIEKLEISGD